MKVGGKDVSRCGWMAFRKLLRQRKSDHRHPSNGNVVVAFVIWKVKYEIYGCAALKCECVVARKLPTQKVDINE